jgi:hypothetical protein
MTRVIRSSQRLWIFESESSKKSDSSPSYDSDSPSPEACPGYATIRECFNLISFNLIPKFSNFKMDAVELSPTWPTPGYTTSLNQYHYYQLGFGNTFVHWLLLIITEYEWISIYTVILKRVIGSYRLSFPTGKPVTVDQWMIVPVASLNTIYKRFHINYWIYTKLVN